MKKFFLLLPENFCDHEWEIESKGWYQGAILMTGGKKYQLTFYDPVRLNEDIQYDIENQCVFFEKNLVVISVVNKKNMEMALEFLMETGQVKILIPEEDC